MLGCPGHQNPLVGNQNRLIGDQNRLIGDQKQTGVDDFFLSPAKAGCKLGMLIFPRMEAGG
jgi:hypothetical protein